MHLNTYKKGNNNRIIKKIKKNVSHETPGKNCAKEAYQVFPRDKVVKGYYANVINDHNLAT